MLNIVKTAKCYFLSKKQLKIFIAYDNNML